MKKCIRCGLKLSTHTSMKCNEILYREREQLLFGLEEASTLLGEAAKQATDRLEWVKKHKVHDEVKNDPLLR